MSLKKTIIAFSLIFMVVLTGCSMLEGINNTLDYAEKATTYADEVSTFANEVPPLAQQAVTDEQAAQELEQRLNDMKQEIELFNELDEPAVGADLHQQVVDQNKQALKGINAYIDNIENGKLDPSVIENTEVFQTLNDITNIIDQIQQLGS
jgi:TolA-binding protein